MKILQAHQFVFGGIEPVEGADGLVLVTLGRWSRTRSTKRALWSRCKTRKLWSCWFCREEQPKGANGYRPIGNQDYRMERLCVRCVEGAPDE